MSFKSDMSGVTRKVKAISSNKKLGAFLASEAADGMDKFVPYRTGRLTDSARVEPFHIRYIAPYAKYPFYGYGMKFRHDQHPNATSRWDRAYAIADGEKLGKAGTAFLKRLQ